MKINFKEYEEMAVQFSLYVFRWLLILLPSIVFVISFVVVAIQEKEYIINFIVCGVLSALFYYFLKKSLAKSAKTINRTNKIIELKIQIEEDKIIEKVVQENNVETESAYFYKDIVKLGEDKYNFYLYITNKSAVIVNKQKLENIDSFRSLIKDKCVIIKK